MQPKKLCETFEQVDLPRFAFFPINMHKLYEIACYGSSTKIITFQSLALLMPILVFPFHPSSSFSCLAETRRSVAAKLPPMPALFWLSQSFQPRLTQLGVHVLLN